jgi:hypothetical protein
MFNQCRFKTNPRIGRIIYHHVETSSSLDSHQEMYKMYPYLREEDDMEEFDEICKVAYNLLSERKTTRQKATDSLVNLGKKAVRPLVFTLHCEYVSEESDEDYDSFCEEVKAVLVDIGKDALPDLEDFATNEECLIPINEFAQDAIFAVMGLEGEDREKVCHHWMRYLHEEGGKKVWRCWCCDAEFEHEEEE